MDDQGENHFVVDDVSKIIKEAIESTIGGNAYLHDKVNNWTGAVVESCLSVLTKLQKPYKYIGKLILFERHLRVRLCKKMVLGCIRLVHVSGTMRQTDHAPYAGKIRLCIALCRFSDWHCS
ncbi:Dynein light chain Tctex-type [Pseudolycoriella hygida]|uniref:Dynein light chain Tctex-type n=1 Tax=Pseudolycoriella hygida TaxID=35572 RepID=A0A9Q0MK66_9DIPT|nr:Dynein light chain Tctex-type [Pseudolycoriella hygida]